MFDVDKISIVFLLSSITLLPYFCLLIYYFIGWKKTPTFSISKNYTPQTQISVIVVLRNERINCPQLIKDFKQQSYPPFLVEFILIDDYSTDNTYTYLCNNRLENMHVYTLREKYDNRHKDHPNKKRAIDWGVSMAKGSLIVTTDADCFWQKQWLDSIVQYYEQTKKQMIVAPLLIKGNGLLALFQKMDMLAMQGVTASAIFWNNAHMCNGANLAYEKELYMQIGGLKDHVDIPSGDDLFILHKVQEKKHHTIGYLKTHTSIVYTQSVKKLLPLIAQRIRWVSKTGFFTHRMTKRIMYFTYISHILFLLITILALTTKAYLFLSSILFLKFLIDGLIIFGVGRFYRQSISVFLYPLIQFMHIIYVCIIGLLGYIGIYKWKGRVIK